MLQSLFNAEAYVPVADHKYEKVYEAREEAMLKLIAAREAFNRKQAADRRKRAQSRMERAKALQRSIRLVAEDGKLRS